eukprot:TRINITY_DN2586_c4_g1_i1.p1 TRINITY_DN2586_c4_g1~~TRINITY_DN2586_c4_g1_i1.p1  ORF type:complete len:168 (+),score=42.84 TRINITY_DN2586_c4_g1_i1:32-535(+)
MSSVTGNSIVVRSFGTESVLQTEPVEYHIQDDADQVIVRVHSVGVNPVDTYIRSGVYGKLPELPYTPGNDIAGTIHAVGANSSFSIGDRVWATKTLTGGYSQYAKVEAANIYPLPDDYTFQQGAAIFVPYATAYHALFQRCYATQENCKYVLVHGASGGVGHAAVQV